MLAPSAHAAASPAPQPLVKWDATAIGFVARPSLEERAMIGQVLSFWGMLEGVLPPSRKTPVHQAAAALTHSA